MADALDKLSSPIAPPVVASPGWWDTFLASTWAQALPWVAGAVASVLLIALTSVARRRWQRLQARRARRDAFARIAAVWADDSATPQALATGAQSLAGWLHAHGLPVSENESRCIDRWRFGPLPMAGGLLEERAAVQALLARLALQIDGAAP
ncbi:hypothetical protein [Hydrogenophaga sp.]|uniref:hypothetical protein n=1 Tax=Hydrogenophaga sp. TaxID=1904254 RepID=UPI00271C80E2|nr:hypothetical protein [Hydrogenophaga sp.]MDO9253493.1 hypothetical protein [Hydrogenophaga sp.]MDP3325583.1 hypothetical protein [Hydrogenophaga sp.]MDP3885121.1 hypothetical protein [Hydrogenophaga sp.]